MNKRKLGFVLGAIASAFVLAACARSTAINTVTTTGTNSVGVSAPTELFSAVPEEKATTKLEVVEQKAAPILVEEKTSVKETTTEKAVDASKATEKVTSQVTEKAAAQAGHHCSGMYGAYGADD
jgi:hypothetical protein